MAVLPPPSPETLKSNWEKSEPENPPSISSLPDPSSTPPIATSAPPQNPNPNSNPNQSPTFLTPPPPSIPSFTPSFRPPPNLPNSQYHHQTHMVQNPSTHPPGVSYMLAGAASGSGSVMISVSPMRPPPPLPPPPLFYPGLPPGSASLRPYGQVVPNGYMAVPSASFQPSGTAPPPGIPRYPPPYIFHPGFPPRPLAPIGVIPRPIQGIRGVPPVVTPFVRAGAPIFAPMEKPQTTVYVGKIASTVENEFLLSILRLCGPVKSYKRAQDLSDGTPRSFGFCEFESAEGVLRALRLLTKLNIDGQQLVLTANQATREYVERFVEKKTEKKLKENELKVSEKENGSPPVVESVVSKPNIEDLKKDIDETGDIEKQEESHKFGLVTDEDRDVDRDALEKLTNLIEERLKARPLPPPPVQTTVDGSAKLNPEVPTKSRDGDSDVDITRSDAAEDKNDDETTSENKPSTDHDRTEMQSSGKGRRHEKSKERVREHDAKRVKERELERYERERERERERREREREHKIREAEYLYNDRVKVWEARERDKGYQRQYEKDREKERDWERRREILDQQDESEDDDTRNRRRRTSVIEKRRKRQQEKEDDLGDRLREGEEIAEAKKKAIEEQKQKDDDSKSMLLQVNIASEGDVVQEGINAEGTEKSAVQTYEIDLISTSNKGDELLANGMDDEVNVEPVTVSDIMQNGSISSRKLGFGLTGSGKRSAVLSVFYEGDDVDSEEKKMRPLVPIDYSTEEMQAVQSTDFGAPLHLVAAAEFVKRISSSKPKEETYDMEKGRRWSNERTVPRERDRNDDENARVRYENRVKVHDKIFHHRKDRGDDLKETENKKLFDAKQLIDMIPKTKKELFSHAVNWEVYDKHGLHERMRPWISKKITEFLGEEEATLVDYIVSTTKDHVQASQMLKLLESILDDEAEMFVLKMWRMLIFEIKKVETGLSVKP